MSDCFIRPLTLIEKNNEPDAKDAVLNERSIQLLRLFCQKGRKMMKAIVYTTNTGNTERYAKMLGHQIGLPVYSLEDAKKYLEKGTGIIYLGWIMASSIKGYKEADKCFCIRMVCAVGMGATGTQLQEVRNKNQIPASTEVFTLQGGFDMEKQIINSSKELEFAIFCIENVAARLGVNAEKVYNALTEKSDILYAYIIPEYEMLHTQGKEYIVDDIIEVMKERGVSL